MNKPFFIVSDKKLIDYFKEVGFKVHKENKEHTVFINNKNLNIEKELDFDKDKVFFTNRMDFN